MISNKKFDFNLFYNDFYSSLNNVNIIEKNIPNQPKEIEEGNREYKKSLNFEFSKFSKLNNILDKKATQMLFRLNEGRGKALYILGIEDNGECKGITFLELIKSIYFFNKIIEKVNGKYKAIRIYNGRNGFVATIRIYKLFIDLHLLLDI
jgi:elongation factor 1-alpha